MTEVSSVFTYSEDVSSAEAPKPLPVGEYRASVRGVEMSTSKTGKPMAVFTYFIGSDQYPVDFTDGNPDGETLTYYFMLQDDARGRFRARALCEKHGVPASKSVDFTKFIGQETVAEVKHEDYQGAPQARIEPRRPA